jgi:hypothetical protein
VCTLPPPSLPLSPSLLPFCSLPPSPPIPLVSECFHSTHLSGIPKSPPGSRTTALWLSKADLAFCMWYGAFLQFRVEVCVECSGLKSRAGLPQHAPLPARYLEMDLVSNDC